MNILAAVRERCAGDRESYLRLLCSGDAELHREVADALVWEEKMGAFLRRPLIDFVDLARPFCERQVIVERFEIVREVGVGGMGVVYEAFDRRRQQRIAIKAAKPGFQPVLSPELEGALKVRHENICLVNEIHTAATEHGRVDFLMMEFLDGETLASRLATRGRFVREEALVVARQLCAGLAAAHRSGIVHRDLKPANIILALRDFLWVKLVSWDS